MSNICQAGGALFGKKSSFFLKFGQMSKKEEWRNIEKHWLNCPRTSKILTFSQAELLILVIFDVWSLILRWSVIFSKSDLSIFDLIKLCDLKWSLISWSGEFTILVHFVKVIFWSWSLICRVQNFLILVRRKPGLLYSLRGTVIRVFFKTTPLPPPLFFYYPLHPIITPTTFLIYYPLPKMITHSTFSFFSDFVFSLVLNTNFFYFRSG